MIDLTKVIYVRESDGQLRLFDEQGESLDVEAARQVIGALMDAYPSAGYVYLAEKYEDGFSIFKIGMTGQIPSRRLNQIRFDESDPAIELIHIIACANLREARDLERLLHDYFRLQQVRGEWFELSPQDISWFCSHTAALVNFDTHAIMPDPARWGALPLVCIPKRFYAEVFDAAGNRIMIGVTNVAQMLVSIANVSQNKAFQATHRLVAWRNGKASDDYLPAQAMADLEALREFIDDAAATVQRDLDQVEG